MSRTFVLILAVLVLATAPAAADEKCQLIRKASLDMIGGPGMVVVPASINDQPLTMVVDTGGYLTALTESTAKRLGLPIEVYPESGIVVYGGISLRHFTTFSGFMLGHMKAGTLNYSLLPDGFLPPDVDGLLSPDFLANFDLDFDFANGKLNLFSRDHCEGKVIYWTKEPVAVVPIKRPDETHITIQVQLDGHEVKALVDTGASMTTMSLDTAEDLFDLKDSDPKLEHVTGPNHVRNARHYTFKQMTFGDVIVNNPSIILVPDNESKMRWGHQDLILGLDVLRQLHLYIAYGEKNLYVSAASQH